MRTESVLVIPFADGIGDFVNVQPMLDLIRRRFPAAAISVAVSGHGNLLNNDPAIRMIKPGGLDRGPTPLQLKLRPLLPQPVLAMAAGLMFDRELGPFDVVINLFYAWERAMDFRRTWTPQLPPEPDVLHTVDCLAEQLERELEVEFPPAARVPHLVLREPAQAEAAAFWAAHDLGAAGAVVGLVPVSNMQIKRWPAPAWVALDQRLRAVRPGVETLLFCDKPVEKSEWAAAFAAAGSPAIPVYAPLDTVSAMLDRCDLVIGVDTGLLHMAAALGTPWVGLFGPTNPAVTGPYDASRGLSLIAPFRKPASCAGCWKHFKYEDDTCRTLAAPSCMSRLAVGSVLQAALAQLAHPAPGYVAQPAAVVRAPRLVPAAVELGSGLFQGS